MVGNRQRAQIVVVGIEVLSRLSLRTLDLVSPQPCSDRTGNADGHPILQIEDLGQRSLEAIGPEMRAGRGIDELSGNAQTVAPFANTAFEHIADSQLAADVLHIRCPPL